jgi:flagellar basal-body rod protein FlgG
MLRSLWSAASGMIAQQSNIDNISNNLANVNTLGYKKSTVEFQDLLYANMRNPGTTNSEGRALPIGIQLGTGVRVAGTRMDFSSGSLQQTGNPFDLALTKDAFFEIKLTDGTVAYTKDGAFKVDGSGSLVTVDGYKVSLQPTAGAELNFDSLDNVSINTNGGIVKPTSVDTDADIYTIKDATKLVEGPTGFYTGDFEQWTKGEPPNDLPPQGRYYKVELPNGSEAFVKTDVFIRDTDGNLVTIAKAADAEGLQKPAKLITSTMPALSDQVVQVSVNSKGKFDILQQVGRFNLVKFINPQGLEKKGQNLYKVTAASGAPIGVDPIQDNLQSGFVESSNVQVAEEMVKMIVAQRAYELNSKAITTSDEMMGIANNLKR